MKFIYNDADSNVLSTTSICLFRARFMKKMNLYTQDSMNPFVLVYYVNVSEDISTFEDFSFIF